MDLITPLVNPLNFLGQIVPQVPMDPRAAEVARQMGPHVFPEPWHPTLRLAFVLVAFAPPIFRESIGRFLKLSRMPPWLKSSNDTTGRIEASPMGLIRDGLGLLGFPIAVLLTMQVSGSLDWYLPDLVGIGGLLMSIRGRLRASGSVSGDRDLRIFPR